MTEEFVMSIRMLKRVAAASLVTVMLLGAGPSLAAPAQSWNLSRNLMLETAGNNPSGPWSYMSAPMSSLHSQLSYVKLTQFDSPCAGVNNSHCWRISPNADPSVLLSHVTQPFYTINAEAGVPVLHPGQTDAAVVRWVSPITGHIRVLGRFSDITSNLHCGDGVRWYVDKGNNTLSSGALNYTTTGDGKVFSLTTTVQQGQALHFIVDLGANNDSYCDSTELDVLITRQQ